MRQRTNANGRAGKGTAMEHQRDENVKTKKLGISGTVPQEGVGYVRPPGYRYADYNGHETGGRPSYNRLVELEGVRDGFYDAAHGRPFSQRYAYATAETKYGSAYTDDYFGGYQSGYAEYRASYGVPPYEGPGYVQEYNNGAHPGRRLAQGAYYPPAREFAY